jgi:hypothetical protein
MAVRLSALCAGRPTFTLRKIPGTHFCSRLSGPRAIVRLEGLGEVKTPVTYGESNGVSLMDTRFRYVIYGLCNDASNK